MDLIKFISSAVLFFLLTPGIILSLPPGGSKITVALTHAVVFGIVCTLFQNTIMGFFGKM